MFQIRKIFIFISSHPASLFREEENGVEGKGWCESSTLAGLSREKINRLGVFLILAAVLLCLEKGYCSFIKLKRNRH